jgi:hypothetical protein
MLPGDPDTKDGETAPAAARPKVIEAYSAYKPFFDVAALAEEMIAFVPARFLAGLSEVVLTNTGNQPRRVRRSVTKSRKRKVRVIEARGLYHRAWHGKPAWIEIYVDNLFQWYETGIGRWLIRFQYFRETELGDVLFHEIGHHIDATVRPEFREKEDIADDWSTRLRRKWFQERRPWLRRLLRLFVPLMRVGFIAYLKRLRGAGRIPRWEYEKYKKDLRR